jgi:hypothetical protein
MGVIRYFVLSSAFITFFADFKDTSCSADLPPKSTPILSFLARTELVECVAIF